MSAVFDLRRGDGPLVISIPHSGTGLCDGLGDRLNPVGRTLADTDWHVDRLYAPLIPDDATVFTARYSRYVVDLNRPPDDQSLYPGQAGTGLCPTTDFDGQAIYRQGREPDSDEIAARRDRFWRPYHDALAEELARLRRVHGRALLWDAHSIRGEVPRLFDGRLPDLNLGTVGATSCAPELAAGLYAEACRSPYAAVLDGRFKGGYITRHYGRPSEQVHAVQMEIAQRCYMIEAPPWTFDDVAARRLGSVLDLLLQRFRESSAVP